MGYSIKANNKVTLWASGKDALIAAVLLDSNQMRSEIWFWSTMVRACPMPKTSMILSFRSWISPLSRLARIGCLHPTNEGQNHPDRKRDFDEGLEPIERKGAPRTRRVCRRSLSLIRRFLHRTAKARLSYQFPIFWVATFAKSPDGVFHRLAQVATVVLRLGGVRSACAVIEVSATPTVSKILRWRIWRRGRSNASL